MMPSHNTKLFSNAFYLMSGRFISRLLQFVLFVYGSRLLGPGGFGVFCFAFAAAGVMSVFMDLGVSNYSVQQMSRDRSLIPVYTGGGLLVRCGMVGVGLFFLMTAGFALGKDASTLWVLLIMGGMAALDSFTSQFSAVFQAVERMEYQAAVFVTSNLIFSVGGIVCITFFPSPEVLAAMFFLGALLRLSLSAYWHQKKFYPPCRPAQKYFLIDMLKKGSPFALVSIFINIYSYIDSLILSAYASNETVGYYNAAYRLFEAPLFVTDSLTTALFPAVSKLYREDRQSLQKLLSGLIQKAVPLAMGVSLATAFLSGDVIRLLFGTQYDPAARVLPILMFTLIIIAPNTILGASLRAMDRQKLSAWMAGLACLLNVGLNLFIIPRYSYMGAAWTTLATEFFVLMVYFPLVWRIVGPLIDFFYVVKMIAYGAAVWAFFHLTGGLGFYGQAGLGLVAVMTMLFFFGFFKLDELLALARKRGPKQGWA